MPLNIAELQIAGYAHVTAIEPCPMIADGEGSVITGRFVTRQVDVIARVEILGADGSIEVLKGTTIHPIWSLDRNDWVPLGELEVNQQLSGQDGPATVLSRTILNRPTAVYNIEVHGEHVYEVGELGLLVHNTETCVIAGTRAWSDAVLAIRNATKGSPAVNFTVRTASEGKQLLKEALGNINRYKNYVHDILHYKKGFEFHKTINAREKAAGNVLQHIKWYANRTNGHIFFIKPN